MQLEGDAKCMQTNNFGGCGLSSFGVMAPFCLPSKTAKISLWTMDYCIGGIFRGGKISRILHFRKNYTQKTKNLYGSHLIFD